MDEKEFTVTLTGEETRIIRQALGMWFENAEKTQEILREQGRENEARTIEETYEAARKLYNQILVLRQQAYGVKIG